MNRRPNKSGQSHATDAIRAARRLVGDQDPTSAEEEAIIAKIEAERGRQDEIKEFGNRLARLLAK